jgi:hypothetical protein
VIAAGRSSATRAHDVRNRLALLASFVIAAVIVGGCGGAAAPPDPYEQLTTSMKTTWNPIQVNLGIVVTAAGKTITLDPKDIAMVVDTAGAKFGVHVSLPAAGLGIPVSTMSQLGIEGDSLDFDAVYVDDAIYARSALFKPMLKMILGPTGKVPVGDLTGWLKLGTKDELMALGALSGAARGMPSLPPPSGGDGSTPAALKASLEAAGITVTLAGTETHNGSDARHLKMAVDLEKLAANPDFLAGAGPQAGPMLAAMKAVSFAGDLWIDPASNRVIEGDLHMASSKDPTQVGNVTVTAHDPDGSVSLAAPASSVDVPLGILITEMMKLIGKGAES